MPLGGLTPYPKDRGLDKESHLHLVVSPLGLATLAAATGNSSGSGNAGGSIAASYHAAFESLELKTGGSAAMAAGA